jgi:hypothetical protein
MDGEPLVAYGVKYKCKTAVQGETKLEPRAGFRSVALILYSTGPRCEPRPRLGAWPSSRVGGGERGWAMAMF